MIFPAVYAVMDGVFWQFLGLVQFMNFLLLFVFYRGNSILQEPKKQEDRSSCFFATGNLQQLLV